MGKKEKEKLMRRAVAGPQPPQAPTRGLVEFFESKLLELRQEISAKNHQTMETLVRFSKELGKMRTDLTVFMRAMQKTGVVTQAIVDGVVADMKAEQDKFIDPRTGIMPGKPVITQYNCDFTMSGLPIDVVEVKTI